MHPQLSLPFTDEDRCGDYREHLLVASPPPDLAAKIMKEKQAFYDVYKQLIAIKTKPHITVADLWAKEELESSLVALMQEACSRQPRFVTGLHGFAGFESSTIYINVQEHGPFLQLADRLSVVNRYLRSHGLPSGYLVNHPHLTIARRLPRRVYAKAIQDYTGRSFHGSLPVHELVLLKRKHRFDKCEEVATLRLLSPFSLN